MTIALLAGPVTGTIKVRLPPNRPLPAPQLTVAKFKLDEKPFRNRFTTEKFCFFVAFPPPLRRTLSLRLRLENKNLFPPVKP